MADGVIAPIFLSVEDLLSKQSLVSPRLIGMYVKAASRVLEYVFIAKGASLPLKDWQAHQQSI